MGDGLVQARGLTKRFGAFEAVRGIDVDVAPGEVFGFLGPNGAGKSTTMRMIACVSPRTSGSLQVLGMDPDVDGPRIRARIGVVPQLDNLDAELTVRQNLQVYGRYFGLSRRHVRDKATELMEFAQLADRSDDAVEPLSGGMKRRLTIARALVNDPELLLLDEPTTGLDPQARHLLWERLYRLKREGVTQIITTHYMDEAEQLCDRLVVMDGGLIVAEGSPAELIERTTMGLRWLGEPGVRRVILAPSYFARPYNYLMAGADWRFFGYPLADAALDRLHPLAPPQSVLRLHRALGDETRLRILKLLAAGDLYLTEIAQQLELSKPTIKHHLVILRSAGAVSVTEAGSVIYYTLRRQALEEASAELMRFLVAEPGARRGP